MRLARGANDKKHAMAQTLNTEIAIIGVDISKNSFHVVGRAHCGANWLRQSDSSEGHSLFAIVLSIKPGGSAREIEITGGIKTNGPGVARRSSNTARSTRCA